MKVKHKQYDLSRSEIEVTDYAPSCPYYFPKDSLNYGVTLPKEHYEPIPTEQWRDVTEECEFDEVRKVLMHNQCRVPIMGIHGNDDCRDGSYLPYHLRKVSLEELYQTYCRTRDNRGKAEWYAFLVERKVSHD